MSDDSFIIVCAIDFGTTFSGYAFSINATPENIIMNKNWGSSIGFHSYKTATSVLTDENGKFVDFGFDAETAYSTILESKYDTKQHLYRNFKMILHNSKEVLESSTVTAIDGQECNALDIFSHALKYMKDHVIDAVEKNLSEPLDIDMIRWVVTVPAIWSEGSKQFMRKSALKAGLIKDMDSSQLLIALEPEAASLSCRQLELTKGKLTTGTKYMVIDAGGGTVDITTHEVLDSGDVQELYIASGGAWGGAQVDANFVELLGDVLGRDFIEKYRTEYPHDWFMILMAFEKSKKAFSVHKTSPINIPLLWSMGGNYAEFTNGKTLEHEIRENGAEYGVEFKKGTLVITHEASRRLFRPVLDKVVHHINSLLNDHSEHSISYFFLVGGFSESEIFQDVMKKEIVQSCNIVIPSEAQMAVIKGAVLFGHRPAVISSRIARLTYGTNIMQTFVENFHKESKKTYRNGVAFCDDIFKTLVEKGARVDYKDKKRFTFYPSEASQKGMRFIFHSMDRQPSVPQYVDDYDVQKLGEGITVHMPDTTGGFKRESELLLTLGGTEIRVEAKDLTSGCAAKTSINFLSA